MQDIVREASELNLQPGEWPDTLTVEEHTYSFCAHEVRNGEVTSTYYATFGGYILRVVND